MGSLSPPLVNPFLAPLAPIRLLQILLRFVQSAFGVVARTQSKLVLIHRPVPLVGNVEDLAQTDV